MRNWIFGLCPIICALSVGLVETISEAQEGHWTYNREQPNMNIGGITPAMKLK